MELVYLWIEKYRNIKNQGFVFNPNYNIKYEEDSGYLKIESVANPLPLNFYGDNISSVSAIIGANGAGKSNILEFLKTSIASLSIGSYNEEGRTLSFIVIYENYILYEESINIKNQEDLQANGFKIISFKDGFIVDRQCRLDLKKNTYIFYSNIFDGRPEIFRPLNLLNISTNYIVQFEKYNNPQFPKSFERGIFISDLDNVAIFRSVEIKAQIDFVCSYYKQLPFNLPDEILITASDDKKNYFLQNSIGSESSLLKELEYLVRSYLHNRYYIE